MTVQVPFQAVEGRQPERNKQPQRDEPVSIPLHPEEALRGLLKTPPKSEDEQANQKPERGRK